MSSQESFSSDAFAAPEPAKKKKRVSKRKKTNDDDVEMTTTNSDEAGVVVTPDDKVATNTKKTRKSPSRNKKNEKDDDDTTTVESSDEDGNSTTPTKKKKKRAKKADHQRLTERDELPKLWDSSSSSSSTSSSSSYTFRIASFNVAGLRAFLRNRPEVLKDLVTEHNLDVLCLQEIKLQETHVDDPKLKIGGHLLNEEGYDAYYSCSTAKKGYSGTAVFIKRRGVKGSKKTKKSQAKLDSFFSSSKEKAKATTADTETDKKMDDDQSLPIDPSLLIPCEEVVMKMGKAEHDAEGRIITTHFPLFSLCNVYVPNSGQKLERLSYRTEQWDKDLFAYMKSMETKRGVPVIWLGDLNVAHTNLEVWNDGAKHLAKQAGVTAEERASFQAMLDDGPFVDAFRRLHPTAKGHYSYWSQRAGNREPNKGLRLDYFICSPSLFDDDQRVVVRDSYMLPDVLGSDHCPVVLEMEIKKE